MQKIIVGVVVLLIFGIQADAQVYKSYSKYFRKDKNIYFSPEANLGMGLPIFNLPDTGGYEYTKSGVLVQGLSLYAAIKVDDKGKAFIKTGLGFQQFGGRTETFFDGSQSLSEEEKSFLPDSFLTNLQGTFINTQTNSYLTIPVSYYYRGSVKKPSLYVEAGIWSMLYLNTKVKEESSGGLYKGFEDSDTSGTFETVREFNFASNLGFGLNIPKKRYMINIGLHNQFTILPIYVIDEKDVLFEQNGNIRSFNLNFHISVMF